MVPSPLRAWVSVSIDDDPDRVGQEDDDEIDEVVPVIEVGPPQNQAVMTMREDGLANRIGVAGSTCCDTTAALRRNPSGSPPRQPSGSEGP